jgi:hypothetical protein
MKTGLFGGRNGLFTNFYKVVCICKKNVKMILYASMSRRSSCKWQLAVYCHDAVFDRQAYPLAYRCRWSWCAQALPRAHGLALARVDVLQVV